MNLHEYRLRQRNIKESALRDYQELRKDFTEGTALYEDAIIERIGEARLLRLRYTGMVETCGVIAGRKLYKL